MGVLNQILKVLLKILDINQSILASTQHIEQLLEAETLPVPASLKVTYQHTVQ